MKILNSSFSSSLHLIWRLFRFTALTGLNRNTVNRYLRLIRQSVAAHCQRESPFSGDVELDESYCGARRVRGKLGRGERDKIIVFGIYKRNGRVYYQLLLKITGSAVAIQS